MLSKLIFARALNPRPSFTSAVEIDYEDVLGPGVILTASASILGEVTALTYQWHLNDLPIPGATGVTYTLGVEDRGEVRVYIHATNSNGNTCGAFSDVLVVDATIYVSEAEGSALNNGYTQDAPITVAKLLTTPTPRRTKLHFKAGESYYLGGYNFPATSSQITKYGAGARPILEGSQPIAGSWTNTGGGVYSISMAQAPRWIYLNGIAQRLGVSGWIPATAYPSTTIIRGNAATLNAFSSIVGAKLRPFVVNWIVGDEYTITAYNSGTGDITLDASYHNYGTPVGGMNFIIYNQLQFVTANNDWYYDAPTTTLYYKSSVDPSTLNLRAGYNELGVSLSQDTVEISGLEMRHYSTAINRTSAVNHVTINDVKITDCKSHAVFLSGHYNAITNCEFRRCADKAFAMGGNYCIAEGNVLDTIGLDGNYPFGFASACNINGREPILRKNTINNCAYNGLHSIGQDILIEKNIVTNSMKRIRDGGPIYVSGAYATYPSTGNIRNNFCYLIPTTVENNLTAERAMPIYVDHTCNGMTLEDNTCVGGSAGILVNYNTKATRLINNKIAGSIDQGILIREDTLVTMSPNYPNNTDVVIEDNVIGMRSTVPCIEVRQRNGVTTYIPYDPAGNADRNHYVQPYTANLARYRATETGAATDYTLATWRTRMAEDEASTSRTNYLTFTSAANALTEVMVEMNPTDDPVAFNVPANYSDYNGAAFSNPVTIPAWSSLMYFKN